MKYQTPILVTLAHLVLFWWMGFEVQTYQPPTPKRLAVQTVKLASPVSAPPQKKVAKVVAPRKKSELAVAKKSVAKKSVAKKSVAKKPVAKKSVGKQPAVVKKASAAKKRVGASPPRQMEALAVEAIGQPEPEDGYRQGLIQRIQNNLTLPERGEVQLKLTLDRAGSVRQLRITSAASERNRIYIEAQLANLCFPSFGVLFKNQKEYTFLLSLTHD